MEQFESTHKLKFEVAPWVFPDFMRFRIGSCEGLWCSTKTSYDILAITNTQPHNENIQDVFDWFKMSCLRDKKDFRILELWNARFKGYLLRNGFHPDGDGAILFYEDIKENQ